MLIPRRNSPGYLNITIKTEATEGIRTIIQSLLAQGKLFVTKRFCNTPIFPKPGTDEWRLTQDLRAVNDVVIPVYPVLPNPVPILSSVHLEAELFTAIDLCSAFFSVPVHKDSQYRFALYGGHLGGI